MNMGKGPKGGKEIEMGVREIRGQWVRYQNTFNICRKLSKNKPNKKQILNSKGTYTCKSI